MEELAGSIVAEPVDETVSIAARSRSHLFFRQRPKFRLIQHENAIVLQRAEALAFVEAAAGVIVFVDIQAHEAGALGLSGPCRRLRGLVADAVIAPVWMHEEIDDEDAVGAPPGR